MPGAEYRVDVATDISFNPADILPTYNNEQVLVGTFTLDITGLNPNEDYFYRVRSVTGACASDNSTTIAVTTQDAPVATVTSADEVACDAFKAHWTDVDGATNYYIDVSTDAGFAVDDILTDYDNRVVADTFLVVNTGFNLGYSVLLPNPYRIQLWNVGRF